VKARFFRKIPPSKQLFARGSFAVFLSPPSLDGGEELVLFALVLDVEVRMCLSYVVLQLAVESEAELTNGALKYGHLNLPLHRTKSKK
jgi:hypothetical protein